MSKVYSRVFSSSTSFSLVDAVTSRTGTWPSFVTSWEESDSGSYYSSPESVFRALQTAAVQRDKHLYRSLFERNALTAALYDDDSQLTARMSSLKRPLRAGQRFSLSGETKLHHNLYEYQIVRETRDGRLLPDGLVYFVQLVPTLWKIVGFEGARLERAQGRPARPPGYSRRVRRLSDYQFRLA